MAFKMKNPSIMKMAKEAGAAMKMKAPMKLMEKTPKKLMEKTPKKMKSPMKDVDGGKKKKPQAATPDQTIKASKSQQFKKRYFVKVDGKKVSVQPSSDVKGRYTYKGDLIPTSTKVEEGVQRKSPREMVAQAEAAKRKTGKGN